MYGSNKQFLFFLQYFLPNFKKNRVIQIKLNMSNANVSSFQSSGKELTLYQMTDLCIWPNSNILQMTINVSKTGICSGKGRKHCGKRRKCCLSAFSSIPTMFSKGFSLRIVESRDCVVKS